MYERIWTARFSDTDPFGIAHYPRIVDAIHETSDMFMQEIGYSFWSLAANHDCGLPLVQMDLEFENPVEAGDEVTIELTPELGDSSVRFEYVARCDGEIPFSGYEQRVCAERGGGGAIQIPDYLREAMEPYTEE